MIEDLGLVLFSLLPLPTEQHRLCSAVTAFIHLLDRTIIVYACCSKSARLYK